MRVVILAGGLGSRLSEETEIKPKPMVEIGERPILWHILKIYAAHGFNDFTIALGYKGELIKRYFWELAHLEGDLLVRLGTGAVENSQLRPENWNVHLLDTGKETQTGGRLKRLEASLRSGTFMLTYGDGVSDVDIPGLLQFHRTHGRIATVTAVRPPARFGGLVFDGDLVERFEEKPQMGEGWINGGFFVFEPEIFNYLDGDGTSLEADALPRLAADHQLAAYRHAGFWQCMDTLREKRLLEALWQDGKPWKVWED